MINLSKIINLKMPNIKKKHLQYFKVNHLKDLIDLVDKSRKTEVGKFYKFLLYNYKTIIIGKPGELENIIIEIKRLFPKYHDALTLESDKQPQEIKDIVISLNNIFDYDKFRKFKVHKWGAYKYIKMLDIQTCPYCDRNFITIHIGPEKNGSLLKAQKTSPHLDHFLDKATHPYLAISIYNLIPCCYVCNTSFKGSKKFTMNSHFHPFVDGFDNDVRFSIEFEKDSSTSRYDIKDLFSKNYKLKLKIINNRDDNFENRVKAVKDVFQIEEIYNDFHTLISDELINQHVTYTPERIREIYKSIPGLFSDINDVKLTLLGLKGVREVNCDGQPFTKLVNDIRVELGLIENR